MNVVLVVRVISDVNVVLVVRVVGDVNVVLVVRCRQVKDAVLFTDLHRRLRSQVQFRHTQMLFLLAVQILVSFASRGLQGNGDDGNTAGKLRQWDHICFCLVSFYLVTFRVMFRSGSQEQTYAIHTE